MDCGLVQGLLGEGGPEQSLKAAIREKVGLGAARGGYLYHSDHSIPPGVNWDRYQEIVHWMQRDGQNGVENRLDW